MHIELRKWGMKDKSTLVKICNEVDRTYLSNRIPSPYTQDDATWWLNMAENNEGKDGVFRAIIVDGECVGNISVEKKSDVRCKA